MFDNLENVRMHYDELMHQISEPEIASDGFRFQKLMKEINSIKPLVDTYTEYKKAEDDKADALSVLEDEKDEELRELAKEEQSDAEERIANLSEKLKILLLPKDPNDDKDVIMEIRAGAGGDEAALFASDLYRMYTHFAESRGWHTEIIECEETGIGGMKQVNFSVSGQGAYSILKYESGVHRVQRVPVTESGGRIHTSTATVAVMPEAEEVDVEINEKDIRIDVMRASGNGGQCVNLSLIHI